MWATVLESTRFENCKQKTKQSVIESNHIGHGCYVRTCIFYYKIFCIPKTHRKLIQLNESLAEDFWVLMELIMQMKSVGLVKGSAD